VSASDILISTGNLVYGPATSRIVAGATSFAIRNNANSADNILVADAGTVTLRLALPDGSGGTGLVNAQGTVTTNGTAIAAGVTQAQPTLTVTGVTTASACYASIATALPATWQTGIAMQMVVTANTATLQLTNPTAGSITPVAQAVNIKCIL